MVLNLCSAIDYYHPNGVSEILVNTLHDKEVLILSCQASYMELRAFLIQPKFFKNLLSLPDCEIALSGEPHNSVQGSNSSSKRLCSIQV